MEQGFSTLLSNNNVNIKIPTHHSRAWRHYRENWTDLHYVS